MLRFIFSILAALFMTACDGGGGGGHKPKPEPDSVTAWTIGPVINGTNYSTGLPLHPARAADGLWQFEWKPNVSSAHYITRRHGPLTGKSEIRMRYRIDLEPGAKLYGTGCDRASPGSLTLYFQRSGDAWDERPYRWWSKTTRVRPLVSGESMVKANLLDHSTWGSVTSPGTEAEFKAALVNAANIGFTFGNCEGSGHGASSTGPAKFTLLEYSVE